MLGKTVSTMGAAQRDRFRADHIGYSVSKADVAPYKKAGSP